MKRSIILLVFMCYAITSLIAQDLDFVYNFHCDNVGSTANHVRTLSDGSIIFGGQFNGKMDFDPGEGTKNEQSSGNSWSDHYLIRLDSTGHYMSHYTSQYQGMDFMSRMEVDYRDRVYKLVQYINPNKYVLSAWGAWFRTKITTKNGNWNDVVSIDLTFDDQNNIYLWGLMKSDLIINGSDTLHCTGDQTAFILKLNDKGKLLFSKEMNANSSNESSMFIGDIKVGPTGDIFWGGSYTGNALMTFTDIDTLVATSGDTDACAGAMDSLGNLLWLRTWPQSHQYDENITSIDMDTMGNLYLMSSPNALIDNRLHKLDVSGNEIWTRDFSMRSDGHQIHVLPNGDFYLRGRYFDSVDMDPNAMGEYIAGTLYTWQYSRFVGKYDSEGKIIWGQRLFAASEASTETFHIDKKREHVYFGATLSDYIYIDEDGGLKEYKSSHYQLTSAFYYRLVPEHCSEDEKVDYYIKRNYFDTGDENLELGQSAPFYTNDIFRTTTEPSFSAHYSNSSNGDIRNFFFLNVTNRGCASAPNAKIQVYYALPETGLIWPEGWQEQYITVDTNEVKIAGLLAEIEIPRMARNHSWRARVIFNDIPKPWYFDKDNLLVNMLGRIVSDQDPMNVEETGNVMFNVANNNNIGWNLFNIINY